MGPGFWLVSLKERAADLSHSLFLIPYPFENPESNFSKSTITFINDEFSHRVVKGGVGGGGGDNRVVILSPPPLPLRLPKAGRNHLNEEITPLLPTPLG